MKHILLFFGLVIVFGFLHINFITTLGDNVMNVSTEEKNVIQFFFPQGWGFFTRNPREPNYKLYKVEDGRLNLVTFKITSPDNYYGFSRKGSRIGMEMHRIKDNLPSSTIWKKSTVVLNKIHIDTINFSETKPIEGLLYLNEGNYILKEYLITPWSWAKHQGRYSKTYKYIPFQLKKS